MKTALGYIKYTFILTVGHEDLKDIKNQLYIQFFFSIFYIGRLKDNILHCTLILNTWSYILIDQIHICTLDSNLATIIKDKKALTRVRWLLSHIEIIIISHNNLFERNTKAVALETFYYSGMTMNFQEKCFFQSISTHHHSPTYRCKRSSKYSQRYSQWN